MNRWADVPASLVIRPSPDWQAAIQALVTPPACRAGRHQQPPGGLWILVRLIGAWTPPGRRTACLA
jgi:hypothetical protein